MNANYSMFVICVEGIIYYIICMAVPLIKILLNSIQFLSIPVACFQFFTAHYVVMS